MSRLAAVAAIPPHAPAAEPIGDFSVGRQAPGTTEKRGCRSRSFSSDEIIEAIRQWVTCYGEPPLTIDWEPARARRLGQSWRAERFQCGRWPSVRVVCLQFRTFNAAIEAAGLVPRPAPRRHCTNLSGPEAITDAMVEWTRRYGDVPAMADWDPVRARRLGQDWRIARYNQGDWPSARSVALHFGSFAKAATAAGLIPRVRSTAHDQRQQQLAANRHAVAQAGATDSQPGLADLAATLRTLAHARREQDPVAVHAALIDVAGSALAWARLFGAD